MKGQQSVNSSCYAKMENTAAAYCKSWLPIFQVQFPSAISTMPKLSELWRVLTYLPRSGWFCVHYWIVLNGWQYNMWSHRRVSRALRQCPTTRAAKADQHFTAYLRGSVQTNAKRGMCMGFGLSYWWRWGSSTHPCWGLGRAGGSGEALGAGPGVSDGCWTPAKYSLSNWEPNSRNSA